MALSTIKSISRLADKRCAEHEAALASLAFELHKHVAKDEQEELNIICTHLQGDGTGVAFEGDMTHTPIQVVINHIEAGGKITRDFIDNHRFL